MPVIILTLIVPLLLSAQEVKKLDESVLEELTEKRNGKALVLNLWATWCVPCREEIPDLNELSIKYKDRAEVIGVSVDYPDEIESRIIPFMKKQQFNYPVYVNNMKDEDLINYFNVEWNGAVPVTFIYDKKGNLRSFLEGKKSLSEFEKKLSKVINSSE